MQRAAVLQIYGRKRHFLKHFSRFLSPLARSAASPIYNMYAAGHLSQKEGASQIFISVFTLALLRLFLMTTLEKQAN